MTKSQLEAQARRYERALRWALGELGELRTRNDGEAGFGGDMSCRCEPDCAGIASARSTSREKRCKTEGRRSE